VVVQLRRILAFSTLWAVLVSSPLGAWFPTAPTIPLLAPKAAAAQIVGGFSDPIFPVGSTQFRTVFRYESVSGMMGAFESKDGTLIQLFALIPNLKTTDIRVTAGPNVEEYFVSFPGSAEPVRWVRPGHAGVAGPGSPAGAPAVPPSRPAQSSPASPPRAVGPPADSPEPAIAELLDLSQYDVLLYPTGGDLEGTFFKYNPKTGKMLVIDETDRIRDILDLKPGLTFQDFKIVKGGAPGNYFIRANGEVSRWVDRQEASRALPLGPESYFLESTDPMAIFQGGPVAVANARIEQSIRVAARTEEALRRLRGQPTAIERVIDVVRRIPRATKHTVLVFGGVTGTGKSTIPEELAREFFPQSENPFFKFSFDEVNDPEQVRLIFQGSAPGLVGSETPSKLILWLLHNPNGGVARFDEIDKAEPEAVNALQTFIGDGELKIRPHLVKAMAAPYAEKPHLAPEPIRRALMTGNFDEIVLKLTPQHIVVLTTNAGAELYTGEGPSNARGRRLKTTQEFESANARFNSEYLRSALKARGFSDDFLGRIDDFVPFKVIMPDDHALIVRDELGAIAGRYSSDYLVTFVFTPEAMAFLEKESYEPLRGARFIGKQLDQWVSANLDRAVTRERTVRPGDRVVVDVAPGGTHKRATLEIRGGGKTLASYPTGKPLVQGPKELLQRARDNLMQVFERRIFGHREELAEIVDQVIAQLAEAVADPTRENAVVVINLDGSSGIGKTEIAKALAEGLFDNPELLARINMNTVTNEASFYTKLVDPLRAAALAHPEALVALLDELPRAGVDPYNRQIIQNQLLSVIDEGELPANPEEGRLAKGVFKRTGEALKLPPTVIIATGNLALQALGPSIDRMTNRELLAQFRYMRRHPDKFNQVYEANFDAALRGRLGSPIIVMPNSDEELVLLREKFFAESTKTLGDYGVKVTLDDTALAYLKDEYVPSRGGRWIRGAIRRFIANPIIRQVVTREEALRGAAVTISFDKVKREMKGEFTHASGKVEKVVLKSVPRARTEYHPDAIARSRWKTSLHEAGHAVMRLAIYGLGSVAEINTFGGGEGGWMEPGVDVRSQNIYLTQEKALMDIAVSLGGHVAEVLHLPEGPANGASSDFQRARSTMQTILEDGTLGDLAPLPTIFEERDGRRVPVRSEDLLREFELLQGRGMEIAGEFVKTTLQANKVLLLELAQALDNNVDLSMDRMQIDRIARGKLVRTTQAQLKAIKRQLCVTGLRPKT
jgi:ATP-dependent Clp protease ATP-binding subunit ClpA